MHLCVVPMWTNLGCLHKVYTKNRLVKLCHAYGVACTATSHSLLKVMKGCDCMPHPCFADDLQASAVVDGDTQQVVLRITKRTVS